METLSYLLGLDAQKLNSCQMGVRAFSVFFIALFYIRVAGIKSLGSQNAFNRLTILMMGAIMGRAVVAAEQPFFPSLAAVLVIMLLHRLLAWLTFKSKKLGKIFKGEPKVLFEDGELNVENLQSTYTTREDIEEALRSMIKADNLDKVKSAQLERSGEISVVKKEVSG